jgi:methylenetetrahydrofolate dehydrogenase (NADP+)/methenyltetrahydrofolate cyclohydrolase
MIVYGTPVAKRILTQLTQTISQQNLHPGLAIVYAGSSSASERYIGKKIEAATQIGINATLHQFAQDQLTDCQQTISRLNHDPTVHGIIVQLPVFPDWPEDNLIAQVAPAKDVDGFQPDSPFTEATARGIWEMITEFARIEKYADPESFLQGKSIVILGRGRTAGKPTAALLRRKGFPPTVLHSQSEDPDTIIAQADLIISAVGKEHLIHGGNTKPGAYVIGAGVGSKEVDGRLVMIGDLHEDEIAEKAKLYCPTRNGIGPLTVACLLHNTVEAAHHAQNDRDLPVDDPSDTGYR